MVKSTKTLAREARATLARLEREREKMRRRHAAELAKATAEIRKVRNMVRGLEGTGPARSLSRQSGPKARTAILSALAGEPMSQVQIVRETGLNDGTVSYGLRALVESGEVEPTGEVGKSGSRVFKKTKRSARRAA
jgi:DNA-binding IclR family transcriptional regulator